MNYLSEDFFAFFKELEFNNHKDWFDINRKRYEESVKKPFENFVAAILSKIQKNDDRIQISASQAIFRINKDVRFSKDKSPYKTNRSALISPFGTKDKVFPGLYFEINTSKISIYAGAYSLDSAQIQRVREEIVDYYQGFISIIENKEFKKTFGEIRGERNTRVSQEFKSYVETIPYVLNKNFYVMAQYPVEILNKIDAVDFITHHYQLAKPFNGFLERPILG
jgi:uncharacterized protein (TIGR02453 family)